MNLLKVISREINHVIRNAQDTEAKLVAVLQSRAEQNKEKLQVKQLKVFLKLVFLVRI